MLIVSGTSRADNRRELARQASAPVVPFRLVVRRSQLELQSLMWRDYWAPCRPFFEVDLRLVQRLNRLKKAWRQLLQQPTDRYLQMIYCWRYFGLLHLACAIAAAEPDRPNPVDAIARIVDFEVFSLQASGESGAAAALFTARHPLAILGQLASSPAFQRRGMCRCFARPTRMASATTIANSRSLARPRTGSSSHLLSICRPGHRASCRSIG